MEQDGVDLAHCRWHAGSRTLGLVGGTLPDKGVVLQWIGSSPAKLPASWAAWTLSGKMNEDGKIRKNPEWAHRFAQAHQLEWREMVAKRSPDELELPAHAMQAGHFSGFSDLAGLIRMGVAVSSPPGYHEADDCRATGG